MAAFYDGPLRAEISGLLMDSPNSKDGAVWYKIKVELMEYQWFIQRRYSDFEALNKKLVESQGIPRDNVAFPPKKFIGNKDPGFVEKRRKQLDEYLKKVLQLLGQNPPDDLAHFLNLQDYEIIFMLRKMSGDIFEKGEQMLADRVQYSLSPFQIYCINKRMRMAIPPLDSDDKKQDFSHVVEFCSKLENLCIVGSNITVGNSNIVPNQYPFKLNQCLFKNLRELTLKVINIKMFKEVGNLRETLESLSVLNSEFHSINQILLCDSMYQTYEDSGPSYIWQNLQSLNCSNNSFNHFGSVSRLAPKLKNLDLSFNKLTELFHHSTFPRLERVSYSGNLISVPTDLKYRFGNLSILDMSQNVIESLEPFERLYSLIVLNLGCNRVAEVEEVRYVSRLPILESLILTGNPVASTVDYRVKALAYFGNRASAVELDNEKANSSEMDQISIIQAIELAKRTTIKAEAGPQAGSAKKS